MEHRTTYFFFRRLFVAMAKSKLRAVRGLDRLPKDRPFILSANHRNWLDPVYLTAALDRWSKQLPLIFIAATKKHRWTQAVIPIDPKNREQCLDIAKNYLRDGLLIGIFPFGDQSHGENKVRTGVARLSRTSAMPIVPAAIQNARPARAWLALLTFLFQRKSIEINFGTPIELAPVPEVTATTLADDMDRIVSAMQQLNSHEA